MAKKLNKPNQTVVGQYRLPRKWAEELARLAKQDEAALGKVGTLVRRYIIEGIKRDAV
jgi:hypothetical protein